MRVRPLTPGLAILGLCFLTDPAAAQGVNLDTLIETSKNRDVARRPALEKKLAPFLAVLESRYKNNWVAIDEQILEVVKLGPEIVPLLLEKLEPSSASPANLNLASNCARVLAKMAPGILLQPLIDILQGESYSGVVHAIPLLGRTGSPQAGAALTQLLDRKDVHQAAIIDALFELGYQGAAVSIARRLPISGRNNDMKAAAYLAKVASAEVVPHIFRALGKVTLGSQIMRYVGVLRTCARQDPKTADRLLPYFDNQKLDRTELSTLADALAVIAPVGHKPTIERLKTVLESGDTGGLELRTAVALRSLGDKTGPAALRKTLIKKTRGKARRNYLNHANLGEYHLEFGDYKAATTAYKAGISVATGNAIRAMLYLQLARAQAKREKWQYVRDALRDSKMPLDRIQKAAQAHPEIAEALTHEPVKKFIDAFGK